MRGILFLSAMPKMRAEVALNPDKPLKVMSEPDLQQLTQLG